jgi:hypothetical protein
MAALNLTCASCSTVPLRAPLEPTGVGGFAELAFVGFGNGVDGTGFA